MQNKNYFENENEFIKNKDAALSNTASSILIKIILIENLFREHEESSLENTTLKNYNCVLDPLYYLVGARLKNDFIFLDSHNKVIENSYTQSLKNIDTILLNNHRTLYFNKTQNYNDINSDKYIELKIDEILNNLGFQNITNKTRFKLYENWLTYCLKKSLHKYIPNFINALQNKQDYELTLDIFDQKYIFLTTDINRVKYFDHYTILNLEDEHEKFLFQKRVFQIELLFFQIPSKFEPDSIFFFDINENQSTLIIKNNETENILFTIEEGFRVQPFKKFEINPHDFKTSLMSILFYLTDAYEDEEIKENEQVVNNIILKRENIILKSNLKEDLRTQLKKRI